LHLPFDPEGPTVGSSNVQPVQSIRPTFKTLLLAGLVILVIMKLMQLLELGCDNTVCHRNGYAYGARLFLGSMALAWAGRLFVLFMADPSQPQPRLRLFTSIAIGLTATMTYVYARSWFNHMALDVPITRWEVFGLLAALAAAWHFKPKSPGWAVESAESSNQQIWFDLALLLALCILIAGRELPREILLSSDPDFHGFIGKQIQRFGGVPFNQHDWGPQSFNYPAGSGVTLFAWYLVGGLDPRDALAALPLLFTFLGALVVAESLIGDLKQSAQRLIILSTSVLLTAAGLLYPLYQEYAHMEGSARQLSILFVALFMVLAMDHFKSPRSKGYGHLVLPAMLIGILMGLNPANVVIPGILLFASMVHGIVNKDFKALKLPIVLLGGVLLALLDPYYHTLLGIAKQARIDTVIYADKLVIKDLASIAKDTTDMWVSNLSGFAHDLSVLLAELEPPLFLILFGFFAVCAIAFGARPRFNKANLLYGVSFALVFYLVYGFSLALTDDRRFFLLSPYIFFSMSQFKAMLLVWLAALAVKKVIDSGRPLLWGVAASALLILPALTLIRDTQTMLLFPRQAYCGAFECVKLDDRVLLRKFEKMVKNGDFRSPSGKTPKVLLANWLFHSEIETWIFPVSGGRLYPYMDLLPAAFYYYQGDIDYSTRSYLDHVCEHFDRPWLLSKGIQYIFLPSDRKEACVDGMEGLVSSEDIVLQEGNAYLLKLKPGP
jgi:hypothetical protein